MRIIDAVFVYQMKEVEEIRWHGRFHQHGAHLYEIHYFLQGEGTFLNDNTYYRLSPGMLFVTGPETQHSIQAQDLHDPITYYAVLIEVPDSDHELRSLLAGETERRGSYTVGTNRRFFFEEIREKGLSGQRNLQMSAAHQLISFLYQLSEDDVSPYGREESIHLEKAITFMQNNVMGSVTLTDIANHIRLNESYFIRLFRRRVHNTPMKYYMKLKIEAAGAMLAETTLSVKEIAAKLHFYSEFHFSRTFKAYTGLAPTNYRKNYLQKLGVSPDTKKGDPQ